MTEVIVATPAETGLTEIFVPKLKVPAVPTRDSSSKQTIPVPDAVTPDSPDPSPTNLPAVQTPVILTPPSPVRVPLTGMSAP